MVYRKKTHTYQYLNFESQHLLHHKLGVIRTLMDSMNNIVTEEEEDRKEEEENQDCPQTVWLPTVDAGQSKSTNGKQTKKHTEKD